MEFSKGRLNLSARSADSDIGMHANDLVLVRGVRDTRETLEDWNRRPWDAVGRWALGSLAITAALLGCVYMIARLSSPDPTPVFLPGVNKTAGFDDIGHFLYRNSLVLALHAMACVAGFIAGSSLPQAAQHYNGWWRWVHDKAGPLAIGFVVCATTFSLATQAYVLGGGAATLSGQLGMSPGILLISLLPHALPELMALFLPLAAWIIASRAGEWHTLLAATFVTVAIAVPVLLASAFIEVYVSPKILLALLA